MDCFWQKSKIRYVPIENGSNKLKIEIIHHSAQAKIIFL